MNLDKFTGSGSTPSRREFWDKVAEAVLSLQKCEGRNASVDEHQGLGTVIHFPDQTPSSPTGCASLGDPTCTFTGITLDCGCISDGIDGPVDWQDGEFGPSYEINQAITLTSGLFGCSPCSDEACWSFFGSPIDPRPIVGWHLGCAGLTAGVDVWGFVLCNGDTELEVALLASHGDDPQPIFFHGIGTRDVPISNDLVCGGGLFNFPFCGLTDWSVRGQGGSVTVTF